MKWVGAAIAVLICASAVRADDVEALLKRSNDLRRAGRDRDALEELEKAAKIERSPRVVAQLALAEQALGLWVKAETDMKEALGAAHDPWINKNRASLEQSLQLLGKHLGTLDLWGEPAGAEVLIDDQVVGKLPLAQPVRVAEGEVVVTVRAPGFGTARRPMQIAAGEYRREHLVLHAAALAAPPPAPDLPRAAVEPKQGADANLVSRTDSGESPASVPEGGRPVYARWWFWVGIGVVAVGATAAALVLRDRSGGGNTPACPMGFECPQ
jgi:hypothetical protein